MKPKNKSLRLEKQYWRDTEEHVVKTLSMREKILKGLTEDEIHALRISIGVEVPDTPGEGPYTRSWVCGILKQLGKTNTLGKMVLHILRQTDLKEIMPYVSKFVSDENAGLKISGDGDGDPIQLQHNLVAKLDGPPESVAHLVQLIDEDKI